jgi:hypothetical protein
LLGAVLLAIVMVDPPFVGTVAVSTEPIRAALQVLE